jgi:phage tail sheath protein FI
VIGALLGIALTVLAAMVGRPGVSIIQRETPPPRSAPGDTSIWFVAGLADQGPVIPTLIASMADFVRNFGPRVSYSILYDALDTYFREGGSRAYISRVVGPGATVGSHNLLDAGAAISLVANALGPGAFSSGIKVGVVAGGAGGTFQIQVSDAGNVILEQSPDLADNSSAVQWSQQSQYIRLVLGPSANIPAVAALAALSAGTDDRTNIADAHWLAALTKFTPDLGPGQVSAPGRTSDTGHTQLLGHAQTVANRRAILDAPDTPTEAALKTSAGNARGGGANYGRFGAMFAPWDTVPGLTPGTTRTVPPSARVAGNIARNELRFGPNEPAAGDRGEAQFAVGLTQDLSDAALRDRLNSAGVNVSILKFGGVRTYGWRSLVDPNVDPYWVDFGNVRLAMAIASRAAEIGESFLFEQIDGQGHTISAFGGVLTGMLLDFYNEDALFGASAGDAFSVDVGDQVNTPSRIADNELHAVLNVRMSPDAELVQIEIVKTPVDQAVVS